LRTRGKGTRRFVGALQTGALVFALGCNSGLDLLESAGIRGGPIELPPIEMEGVIFEGYHGDLRDLSVTADSATVDMTAHVANLRQVSMGFSGEDAGKVEISAPVGVFHLDGEDFTLSNGVRGKSGDGESDSPVELRRANLVLTASGMELEVATHKLRLTGNVRARVQPR